MLSSGERIGEEGGNKSCKAMSISRVHRARLKPTQHSRHQTPPSGSLLAALSSFFPHPGSLGSRRPVRPRRFLPPQLRQAECHLVPEGPGTTPHSIGETAFIQPGQDVDPPNLGNLVWLAGAVARGCSNRFDIEVETPLENLVAVLDGGIVFVSLGVQRTWQTPWSVLTNVAFPP